MSLAYHLVRGEWDLLPRLFHLAFCSRPLFLPLQSSAGQRVRESVYSSQHGNESSPEKLQTGRETHPSQARNPTHTHTHTHSPLPSLFPRSNNGCFLTTGVTVTSWATSRRSVKSSRKSRRIRKEPRSYSTSNHHQSKRSALWFIQRFLTEPSSSSRIKQTFHEGGFSWPVCCLWMQHDSVF